jgi:hypothetical protein
MLIRPQRPSELSEQQRELKKQWDAEYKSDSDARANKFYTKKHTIGITPKEEGEFKALDKEKWEAEQLRRVQAGLMYEVDEVGEEWENFNKLVLSIKDSKTKLQGLGEDVPDSVNITSRER